MARAAARCKVVIDNYPGGQVEELRRALQPRAARARARARCRFARVLYIERDDFREDPPKKWFRLAPGREVRLRYACLVTCDEVVKDERRRGRRAALHLGPRVARRQRARRPQGQGHHALGLGRARAWTPRCASTTGSSPSENPHGRQGGRLQGSTSTPTPWRCCSGCKLEPSLAERGAGQPAASSSGWATSASTRRTRHPTRPVFNRTVSLRDTWAKLEKKAKQQQQGKPGTSKKSKQKQNNKQSKQPSKAEARAEAVAGCPPSTERDYNRYLVR